MSAGTALTCVACGALLAPEVVPSHMRTHEREGILVAIRAPARHGSYWRGAGRTQLLGWDLQWWVKALGTRDAVPQPRV